MTPNTYVRMGLRTALGGGLPARQLFYLFLIIFVAFVETRLFSCLWLPMWVRLIDRLIPLLLAVWWILHNTRSSACHFRTEVLLLMFLPWLSSFNSYVYYGQSFIQSAIVLVPNFTWAAYFLLHYYRVREGVILKAFLFLALFIVGVQIVQQFSYPDVYFGVESEEEIFERGATESAEMRNGLWRFRMHCNGYLTCPILFALWLWLREKYNGFALILTALFFVSIYLSLTRQVMAACILAVFCSYFIGGRKVNVKALILGLTCIFGLYIYYDVLFSALGKQTAEEANDSYVRVLAATYFMNESLRDPITLLCGYGLPSKTGAFADLRTFQTEVLRFFACDVGFIGKTYEYGLLYVIVCYRVLWMMFFKYKRTTPEYIRLFVIFTVAMSPMIFPTERIVYWFEWALLMYVCDLHINHSPLALRSTSNIVTNKNRDAKQYKI